MLSISATELPRFMQCNGSRLMHRAYPEIERDDTIREEGIAAHWVVQQVFENNAMLDGLLNKPAPNGVFITADMLQHVSDYIDEILVLPFGPSGHVEHDTSHGETGRYQINGRADHVLFENGTLYINDFKYGYRIVEPDLNWTLISHAIGYTMLAGITPSQIVFGVFQPRASHPLGTYRTWQISYEEFYRLYKQLIATISNPSDVLNTGPACAKCPALANCPSATLARMNAIDTQSLAFSEDISDGELAYELDLLMHAQSVIENGLEARKELAKYRIKQGRVITNYSVETELTNRQWKTGLTVDILQALTGKQVAQPAKLGTPAEAERRGIPKNVVETLTERRPKGMKLIRIDANKNAQRKLNG